MKYIFTRLIIVISLLSCYKDESIFIPDQTNIINSDLLLSKFISNPTSLIVALKEGNTIVQVSNDLIVDIPHESLTDATGKIVDGEIKLEIKDYSNKKYDLLRCPRLIYNDQLINTQKLLYVGFSKNGQPLYASHTVSVYVRENIVNESENFQLLIGQNSDEKTQWYAEKTPKFEIKAKKHNINVNNEESVNELWGYKIDINGKDSWYCISEKIEEETLAVQQISVTHNNEINQNNTIAYFISDVNNTVVKLESDITNSRFKLKYSATNNHISGNIILFSQFGDEIYHFGITNVVLGKDELVNVKSEPKEIKEIKAILASL